MTEINPTPEPDFLDKVSLEAQLDVLRTKGQKSELTSEEICTIITITRTLRRTHTGPAKAKKAPKKAKNAPLSDEELSNLIG